MSNYQLPPLKSAEKFEHLLCDLLNKIESSGDYKRSIDFQLYGVKGQSQNGIDIISQRSLTLVQCKQKILKGKDDSIRKKILADVNNDLLKIEGIKIPFNRLIFASTFRDDAFIQEFLIALKNERNYPFLIYYWGWDTITKYVEEHDDLIKKYFQQFGNKRPGKSPLPEGALGNDLLRKNYATYLIRRYGDFKQAELKRRDEKFNWGALNKSIYTKYKAAGINHIPVSRFGDLVDFLQAKIDKTILGRTQKSKGGRNYSSFEQYLAEINQSSAEKGV